MDLRHDNLGVSDVAGAVVGIQKKYMKNRKLSQAEKAVSRGEYWGLTPYQKSLIPIPTYIIEQVRGLGVTEQQIKDFPPHSRFDKPEKVLADLKLFAGGVIPAISTDEQISVTESVTSSNPSNMKKYVPYILGAVVIGLIIYFVVKR